MNGLINDNKEIIGLMDKKTADGTLVLGKSNVIPVNTNKGGEL